ELRSRPRPRVQSRPRHHARRAAGARRGAGGGGAPAEPRLALIPPQERAPLATERWHRLDSRREGTPARLRLGSVFRGPLRVAQRAAQDLADVGLGQLVAELDGLRDLVTREVLAAVREDGFLGQ